MTDPRDEAIEWMVAALVGFLQAPPAEPGSDQDDARRNIAGFAIAAGRTSVDDGGADFRRWADANRAEFEEQYGVAFPLP